MCRSELESSQEFQRLIQEEDTHILIITDYYQVYGPFPSDGIRVCMYQPCKLDTLLFQIECTYLFDHLDPVYVFVRLDGQYQLIVITDPS